MLDQKDLRADDADPRDTAVRMPGDGLFGKTIQPAPSVATLSMSRRHHIYAVGGRGGGMLYKPGFLADGTLFSFLASWHLGTELPLRLRAWARVFGARRARMGVPAREYCKFSFS